MIRMCAFCYCCACQHIQMFVLLTFFFLLLVVIFLWCWFVLCVVLSFFNYRCVFVCVQQFKHMNFPKNQQKINEATIVALLVPLPISPYIITLASKLLISFKILLSRLVLLRKPGRFDVVWFPRSGRYGQRREGRETRNKRSQGISGEKGEGEN